MNVNSIFNRIDGTRRQGTGRRDYIINTGNRVTVAPGAGCDTIEGSDEFGDVYLFSADDDHNLIVNFDANDTLSISGGTIESVIGSNGDCIITIRAGTRASKVTLAGADVFDFIRTSKSLTVDYVETIENSADGVNVQGTGGRDLITNRGERVTILSGTGNDTITGSDYGEIFVFGKNGGANVITDFDKNDTLTGAISFKKSGSDVIVSLDGGSVTLQDAARFDFKQNGTTLTADYVETINNSADGVSVLGTGGRDLIINDGERVTIASDAGNDTIIGSEFGEVFVFGKNGGANVITDFDEKDTLTGAKSFKKSGKNVIVSLDGGSVTLQNASQFDFKQNGATLTVDYITTIPNTVDAVNVLGTAGRDSISNSGEHVTISSGAGDDTITGSEFGEVFVFGKNGGANVITDFDEKDILTGAKSFTASGSDVVVSLDGGSVTLQNAANLLSTYGFKQSGSTLAVDYITTIPNTVDAVNVLGTAGRDSISNRGEHVTISSGAGNDTITGSEFGDVFVFGKNGGANVITDFDEKDTLTGAKSFKKSGKNVIVSLDGGSVTLQNAANLLSTYGFKQNGSTLAVDYITTIPNDADSVKVVGTDGRDRIITGGEKVTIQPGKGDDTITGSNNGEVFLFNYASGANVITNFGHNDTLRSSSGTITAAEAVGKDAIVTISKGKTTATVTLQGAASLASTYGFKQTNSLLTVDYITTINNDKSKVKVTGTSGRDWIENDGDPVTIAPGAGNDTITGSEFGDVFVFGKNGGANVITNFDGRDTLTGAKSFKKSKTDVIVSLDGGSVTLTGAASLASAYGFKQNGATLAVDYITTLENDADSMKMVGTNERDVLINNGGEKVTLQPGKGNDTLIGSDNGEVFLFNYASGADVITNFGYNDTLRSSSGTITSAEVVGKDVLVTIAKSKTSATVTLVGAASLASTYGFKQTAALLTVDYITTIDNGKSKAKVTGTGGRDLIINDGDLVTIAPGAGDDTITGSDNGEVFVFAKNGGANVITDFGVEDTLIATGGIKSVKKSGKNALVSLTGGTVTLTGAGDYKFVKNGSTLTVDYTSTLENTDDNKKITGTDGSDWIINGGQNVTICPDGGDDTIDGDAFYGEIFLINAFDGNNVISDFGINDTLKIPSGAISSSLTVADDLLLTLKSGTYTGTVTLKNAAKQTFSVNKNKNLLTIKGVNRKFNRKDNVKLSGSKDDDLLENTGENVTINGGAGNDTIIGSDIYGDLFQFAADGSQDVITNFGENDTLQLTSGTLQSSMKFGDDIIFNVKGTKYSGSITLKNAGHYLFDQNDNNLTVRSVNYIINRDDNVKVTGTSKVDYIANSGNNVTIVPGKGNDTIEGSNFGDAFTFAYNHGNNVILNFDKNDTLTASSGTLTTTRSGDDMIATITKGKTKSTVTLPNTEKLIFEQNGNTLTAENINYIDNDKDGVKIPGTKNKDWITNIGSNVTIAPGKGNDTIEGSDLDGDLFQFAYTHGDNVITNFGKDDSLQSTSGTLTYKKSGKDMLATITKGKTKSTVRLLDAAGYDFVQTGNVLTLDWIETIDNDNDNARVTGTSGRDLIENNGFNVTIQPNSGDDTITGSMFADMYIFSSSHGDNLITNFGAGDTLKMSNTGTLTYKPVGKDVLVTLKGKNSVSGSVTLQGAASLDLKKSGRVLYADIPYTLIENDADKKKITGTSGADMIINHGENVTITPGKGNDTIIGSDQYGDLYQFAYTGGENVIANFGAKDTLKSTSGTLSYKKSGGDYIVSITKGKTTAKITLDGAASSGTLTLSKDGNSLTMNAFENAAQLPCDQYWFEEPNTASDELTEIISDDAAIDLNFDQLNELLKTSATDLTNIARNKKQK